MTPVCYPETIKPEVHKQTAGNISRRLPMNKQFGSSTWQVIITTDNNNIGSLNWQKMTMMMPLSPINTKHHGLGLVLVLVGCNMFDEITMTMEKRMTWDNYLLKRQQRLRMMMAKRKRPVVTAMATGMLQHMVKQ
jgi:hypothetical protein